MEPRSASLCAAANVVACGDQKKLCDIPDAAGSLFVEHNMMTPAHSIDHFTLQTLSRQLGLSTLALAVTLGVACDDREGSDEPALAERADVVDLDGDANNLSAAPSAASERPGPAAALLKASSLQTHGIGALRVGHDAAGETRVDLLDDASRPIGWLVHDRWDAGLHLQFSWSGVQYEVLQDGERTEVTVDGIPAREAFGLTAGSSGLPLELAPVLDLAGEILIEADQGPRPGAPETLAVETPTSELTGCINCELSTWCFLVHGNTRRNIGYLNCNTCVIYDWECGWC